MDKKVIRINGRITINIDVSVTNVMYVKKYYIWNPATSSRKYVANITDDSGITCDEIIESYHKETKTVPTNFNEKKSTYKTQNSLYFTCIFINKYSIIDSY